MRVSRDGHKKQKKPNELLHLIYKSTFGVPVDHDRRTLSQTPAFAGWFLSASEASSRIAQSSSSSCCSCSSRLLAIVHIAGALLYTAHRY